ncbi:MAG TPA: TfoX/Sxy family protein [Thermoanaerobaculia bacterium]|nr:TfoX/Sxy family protein [Thermoanaerobaculia bacterium]
MAYDEALAHRVRSALTGRRIRFAEKRMFSGVTFMVQQRMCVSVGPDRLMCRIDPELHDDALRRKGCRAVTMRGREYRGFVYVDADAVRTKSGLDHWLGLALAFNPKARRSARKRRG